MKSGYKIILLNKQTIKHKQMWFQKCFSICQLHTKLTKMWINECIINIMHKTKLTNIQCDVDQ